MQLVIAKTERDFHRDAAARVSRQVLKKPDSLIGLATGGTTLGIHQWMIRFHRELGIDYSQCKTCNLDEYIGVSADDPSSCRYRINNELLNHLNIRPENTYVPDGLCSSPKAELEIFKKTVEGFGGIDLQVLSIGQNGHIAFNEPGTSFDSTYHLAPISKSTVEAKAGLFGGEDRVPKQGISMGIRDIMAAKALLVVASGEHKAEVVQHVINGPITEDIPATIVRLHPYVTIIIDQAAAKLLR